MFIGRSKELQRLQRMFDSENFEFAVIYGRRRVGKSTLIKEFIADKRAIFFTATQSDEEENLLRFSENILCVREEGKQIPKLKFDSFSEAFAEINQMSQSEKLILVIDEYPYLAESFPAISSILQEKIDNLYLQNKNLLLILCGSQMSFMEHQVLGYQSPLYGRRTAQFKIKSFDFWEAKQMLPKLNDEDFLTIYAVTGGIPLYLKMINDQWSLKKNLCQNFFTENTFLFEEPNNLLKQEVRVPAKYNSIITAIATGSSEMNQIATKTNLTTSNITSYLNNLLELGIIAKKSPLSSIAKKRKTIYEVSDGLFNFWYRYVPRYQLLIAQDKIDLVWQQIKADLPNFTAKAFEKLAQSWVMRKSGTKEMPVLISAIGNWWGTNPQEKTSGAVQEEVDVVGLSVEKEEIVLGECKWRGQKTDLSVLKNLLRRAKFFPYNKKFLYLFSKADFTKECREKAYENDVNLVTYQEMIEG